MAGLAGAALLGGACTAAPVGPARPAPSFDELPGVEGDRLLVLAEDGTILTVTPDGGDPVILRRPGPIDVEASQPVWAPDGSAVSWVEVATGAPPTSSLLVTTPPARSVRTEVPVDAAMFYLQWDPTSRRVAYLGASGESIGFGWAEPDAEEGAVAQTIRRGNPFYVSWAPEGDRLLVHVGTDRLGRLGLDGKLVELGERPGLFHAPVWLPDDRLVYVTGGSERQALVIRDRTRIRVLHRFRGAIEFVVSPDAERIAYRVDAGDAIGPLAIVDVATGRSQVIADVAPVAFEWSPDGRRLLVLGQQPPTDPTSTPAPTGRWFVWNGRTAQPVGVPFFPSPRYVRDYLPFFGQYTQTMTLWSPDGRSFAFAALIGDRDGIWVQDVDAEEPSLVVEDGSIVAWSPVDL